jgi:lycopene beta-cyclase
MTQTISLTPHSPSSPHFDYIISGAGAAGLSLLLRMVSTPFFSGKSILLVDKEPKIKNDRTWCFWEKEPGFFEPLVYKSWSTLFYYNAHFSRQLNILPYRYKMIRGIDFYNHCFFEIALHKNVTVLYGTVGEMHSNASETYILVNGKKYTAGYIFNSILFEKPLPGKKGFYLLQHFKGWIIETGKPVFNEAHATLMDFRVPQHKGTSFVYVMPFSPTRALVEYTMFSEHLLKQEEYDISLRDYITRQLDCGAYTITEEEFGIIPMTNYRFSPGNHRIINMGTAGGQTKASTGYTFMSVQKKAEDIVAALQTGKHPMVHNTAPAKYHFYDSVLLNVLATRKLSGEKVFSEIFRKNHPHLIFHFLDNDSSLMQDLKIISSLPTMPFLKAGAEELLRG